MINIRSIKKLNDGDGATLKKGKFITYKTGYQVATEGIETTDPARAIKAVKAYNGDCGLWYEKGVYYVDKSHREPTRKKALEVGKANNQISVYGWKNKELIYC